MLVFFESEREGVKQVVPNVGWLVMVAIALGVATVVDTAILAPRKRRRRPPGMGGAVFSTALGVVLSHFESLFIIATFECSTVWC